MVNVVLRCVWWKDLRRCFGANSGGLNSLFPALSMRVNSVVFSLTHFPTSYAVLNWDWLTVRKRERLANPTTGRLGLRQVREAGTV